MKRKFMPVLLATVLSAGFALHSLTASATLKPGDTAPDFTTQASLGGKTYTYTLADELNKLDPNSEEAREIGSILAKLDELCGD